MEPESAPPPPPTITLPYEQIYEMVTAEFSVEEGFIEYNTPTFYVKRQPNLKQAFVRLYGKLNDKQLVPILRERADRIVLHVVSKPPVKRGNPMVNIALFIATVITTLITGYLFSSDDAALFPELMPDPWIGAVMFSVAVMSIFLTHEMGHKLMSDRHKVEATYPYFIPGLPPFGTFGAVIQQKSLPPNKDSLFDLGISGPIIGFVVTAIVTIIGIRLSVLLQEVPPDIPLSPLPELFGVPLPFLFGIILILSPPAGSGSIIWLHPLVRAGLIGMIVTMLNLMPIGQLDGGHIVHVLFNEKVKVALALLAILALVLTGYWFMALLAFLIARIRHPEPLDSVSKLSTSRKLATVFVVIIMVLSFAILTPVFFYAHIFQTVSNV